jgi:adenylyltransferase/sulfurtransferase
MTSVIGSLRKQIASCEATLQDLRQQLAEAEHNQRGIAKVVPQKRPLATDPTNPLDHDMNFGVPDLFREEILAILKQEQEAPQHSVSEVSEEVPKWPLEKNEYKRYGRQLIMPEIGLKGESSLPYGAWKFAEVEISRSTSLEGCSCTYRRCGWSWLPSCCIFGRSRRRYCRTS